MTETNSDPIDLQRLVRYTKRALLTLPKREELTLRLRFGISGRVAHSYREIADVLGYSTSSVRRFEQTALRRLRDPSRAAILAAKRIQPRVQDVCFVVEKVKKLTPELILHLKSHNEDLDLLHWEVFQHLVGEFLACHGFSDVRIVGRNPGTSADLYAARTLSPTGLPVRVFVEVKRTSGQLGIDVINEVAGAMLTERSTLGWHAAMIVSTAGFKTMHKFNPYQLSLRGIELRDKQDLLRWIDDYQPNDKGLWLPSPTTELPEVWRGA